MRRVAIVLLLVTGCVITKPVGSSDVAETTEGESDGSEDATGGGDAATTDGGAEAGMEGTPTGGADEETFGEETIGDESFGEESFGEETFGEESSEATSFGETTVGEETSGDWGEVTEGDFDGSSSGWEETSGAESCLGDTGETAGTTDPWLEVWNEGVEVASGGELRLACEPSFGFWFVELQPYMDGFDPGFDAFVYFDVFLSVEGFDLGPQGLFSVVDSYAYPVSCDAAPPPIPIFPPGELTADPFILDGAPAFLDVVLRTYEGEEPPVAWVSADVTMVVQEPYPGAFDPCLFGP